MDLFRERNPLKKSSRVFPAIDARHHVKQQTGGISEKGTGRSLRLKLFLFIYFAPRRSKKTHESSL